MGRRYSGSQGVTCTLRLALRESADRLISAAITQPLCCSTPDSRCVDLVSADGLTFAAKLSCARGCS